MHDIHEVMNCKFEVTWRRGLTCAQVTVPRWSLLCSLAADLILWRMWIFVRLVPAVFECRSSQVPSCSSLNGRSGTFRLLVKALNLKWKRQVGGRTL